MKKSLTESKAIRFYVLLWGVFILGTLIALPFSETQSQWRYVAFAGFLLSAGSFMLAIHRISSVQSEIRARYSQAQNDEKGFLTAFFYFVRGIFLLMGILILLSSSLRKDVLSNDVVEIGGKISAIEIYGGDTSSLKIVFVDNSNEYETRTFKIPNEKLGQIKNELHPGDFVFILIEQGDKDKANSPYIQIYGIRTQNKTYLSINEYNNAESGNNFYGYVLGFFFVGSGLIYLLTGKIGANKGQVMST